MADVESTAAATPNGVVKKDEQEDERQLPPLTPGEFRAYNRMAEHMNVFVSLFRPLVPIHTPSDPPTFFQHEHFRSSWTTLHTACTSRHRPAGMSLRQFLNLGLEFVQHLTIHHTIEEQHIFPVLAQRMPAFRQELELLTQHRQIHEGLDRFEAYLEACRSGERELRWEELREVMDGFGDVLWTHLDQEVRELGAEKMRKCWSIREMATLPI